MLIGFVETELSDDFFSVWRQSIKRVICWFTSLMIGTSSLAAPLLLFVVVSIVEEEVDDCRLGCWLDDAHNCIEYCCKDEEWCFILVVGRELLNNEMCTSCVLCGGGLQPSAILNIDIPSRNIGITILFSIKRLRWRRCINLYKAVGFAMHVNCSSQLSLAWGRTTSIRFRLFVDGVPIISICAIFTL